MDTERLRFLLEYFELLSKAHEANRLKDVANEIEKELGIVKPHSKVTFHDNGVISIEPNKTEREITNLPHGW